MRRLDLARSVCSLVATARQACPFPSSCENRVTRQVSSLRSRSLSPYQGPELRVAAPVAPLITVPEGALVPVPFLSGVTVRHPAKKGEKLAGC